MGSKWAKPRQECLEIATRLVVENDYKAVYMARTMVEMHYMGVGRPQAQGIFARDLQEAVRQERVARWMEKQGEVGRMAQTLKAEGWRFLEDGEGGGIWRHESGWSVNRNGGNWSTWARATRETYESQTRQMLLARESGHD